MQSPASELKIPSKVLRAGAGTGKTTALVAQICSILETSGLQPKMVVTTFTRKAAGELRERLIQEALKQKKIEWVDYFQSNRILIGTIHSVLQQFLRRVFNVLDRDSQFQVVDPAQAQGYRKAIFYRLAKDEGLKGWDELELTVAQLLDLVQDYKRHKAFAGELLPLDVPAQKRLVNEVIQSQFIQLIKEGEVLLEQTANDKIREGVQKTLSLLLTFVEEPNLEALPESIKALGRKPSAGKNEDPEFVQSFKIWWDDFKDVEKNLNHPAFSQTQWPLFTESFKLFQKLAEEFLLAEATHRSTLAWMEIDDLEILTLELLKEDPRLVSDFAKEWDYWLIDEFQDTSPFQEKILKALRAERPYFIVGDPQQSIYLFRGADPEVFVRQQDTAKSKGDTFEILETNYRSRPSLLGFFNDFFKDILPNYQHLKSDPKSKMNLSSEQDTVATFIQVPISENRNLENAAILGRILELKSQGQNLSKIAILGKENKELVMLARYLSQNNVPVFLHTAGSFWNKREVKDALSLLLFLINPWDDENLIGLLRSPWFWMSDQDLIELRSLDPTTKKDALWKVLQAKAKAFPIAKVLIEMQQNKSTQGLIETFELALIDRGFFHLCHWIDPSGKREANLFKLMGKVRAQSKINSSILELARAQAHSLDKDFDDPDGEAVAALMPDAVNMMTVHSSKGLKFGNVILIRADKAPRGSSRDVNQSLQVTDTGQFAIALPMGENQEMKGSILHLLKQEELSEREKAEHVRLLYVALTRAENSVTITMQEKLERGSWLSMFQDWLKEGSHQTGNYHWRFMKDGATLQSFENIVAPQPIIPEPVVWTGTPIERVRSVTQILNTEKTKPNAQPVLLADPIETYFAAPRGTRFHRKMELIKYHGVEAVLQKFGQDQEFWKAIKYLKSLKEPSWFDILNAGEVEWAFQFKLGQDILDGKIDLWGLDKDGDVWIVDYKSGSPTSAEKAFVQLNLYAFPLRDKFPGRKIKLAAIYPFAEQVFVQDAD